MRPNTKREDASASSLFGMQEDRARKGGTSAHTGAMKCPVDTSLARGRVLHIPDASGTDVDGI